MNRIMSSDSDIDSETESLQFFSRARRNKNRLNTFCWSNITVWRKEEKESKHFWQNAVSTKMTILQNGMLDLADIRFAVISDKYSFNNELWNFQ